MSDDAPGGDICFEVIVYVTLLVLATWLSFRLVSAVERAATALERAYPPTATERP